MQTQCTVRCKICSHFSFFFFFIDVLIKMFNCSMGLFISKYLLFIGYIQNVLTVNCHSIFTIVRSSSAPVTNDHRGVTREIVAGYIFSFFYLEEFYNQSSLGIINKLFWRGTMSCIISFYRMFGSS